MELTFSLGDIAALVQAVCAMFGFAGAVVTLWILVAMHETRRLLQKILYFK